MLVLITAPYAETLYQRTHCDLFSNKVAFRCSSHPLTCDHTKTTFFNNNRAPLLPLLSKELFNICKVDRNYPKRISESLLLIAVLTHAHRVLLITGCKNVTVLLRSHSCCSIARIQWCSSLLLMSTFYALPLHPQCLFPAS